MQRRIFTILATGAFVWALLFAVVGFAGAQVSTLAEETTLMEESAEDQAGELQAQDQKPTEEQAEDVSSQAAEPNLSITKQGPAKVQPGKNFVYTIVVKNNGDADATVVEVTDRLPKGVQFVASDPAGCTAAPDPADPTREKVTCTVGTLAPDAERTIKLTVKAPDKVKTIENKATVDSAETEPKDSNAVKTTVAPKLEINKLDDKDPAIAEHNLLYTIRVTNAGQSDATNVVVTDLLDLDKVDFVAIESTQGFPCERNADVVRCEGDIDRGKTVKVELTVEPEEAGTIKNTAKVGVGKITIDTDTESTHVNATSNGGGGGGDDNNGGNCPGAEQVEKLTGTATEDSATFKITGTKFRITSDVSNLSANDTFKIRVEDGQVRTFPQDSEGTKEFFVNEGSGQFTVEVDNPGEARYTITIDDCINSDQNGGGGGGNGGGNVATTNQNKDDNVKVVVIKPAKQNVIKATIPGRVLPNTGGTGLAGLALIGFGLLVAGVSVLRFGVRRWL